ncbi:hypothetical protein [Gordonia sp. NPDC058843]|uniref:hypothetical protein n=1 Tax=Gordonia sp. NPDC058843 TaxID=3346648 RepID=UPI0036BE8E51
MAIPDLRSVAAADTPRIAADTGAAADLAARLTEASAGVAAVRVELSALLLDIEAAVGDGAAAVAFREGFSPAGAASAECLRESENRLAEHRRDLVAGVDALVGTDVEVSASIDRTDT